MGKNWEASTFMYTVVLVSAIRKDQSPRVTSSLYAIILGDAMTYRELACPYESVFEREPHFIIETDKHLRRLLDRSSKTSFDCS